MKFFSFFSLKGFSLFFCLTTGLSLLSNPLFAISEVPLKSAKKLAKEYALLNPQYQKEVELIFSLEPLQTNVVLEIKVDKKVIDKIFTDLLYTAKMAKKYSRSRYEVTKLTQTLYRAVEKPHIEGTLQMFYIRPRENRFIYLVDGVYNNVIHLLGKMLIDVRYEIKPGGLAVFNIKSYIVLTNKFLWSMTKFFRFFPKARVKIDRIISYNVLYVVNIGKKVALALQQHGF